MTRVNTRLLLMLLGCLLVFWAVWGMGLVLFSQLPNDFRTGSIRWSGIALLSLGTAATYMLKLRPWQAVSIRGLFLPLLGAMVIVGSSRYYPHNFRYVDQSWLDFAVVVVLAFVLQAISVATVSRLGLRISQSELRSLSRVSFVSPILIDPRNGLPSIVFIGLTEPLAHNGNAAAQRSLGLLYAYGLGVNPDPERAFGWFRAAATQGDADAQYHLGVMYDQGLGVDRDDAEAVRWFIAAAEAGHRMAQFNAGVSFWQGSGIRRIEAEAYKWLKLSETGGFVPAREARDALARCLPERVIEEAKDLVSRWRPRGVSNSSQPD